MLNVHGYNIRKFFVMVVSLAAFSVNSEAKPKLRAVQGLPQTGEVARIRTGSDDQGEVFISWLSYSGLTLNLDKVSSVGVPEAGATVIAGSGGFNGVNAGLYDLIVKPNGTYLAAWAQIVPSGLSFTKHVKAVLSSNLSSVLDYGEVSDPVRLELFTGSDNSSNYAVVDSERVVAPQFRFLNVQGQPTSNHWIVIDNQYSSVTMSNTGDALFMAVQDSSPSTIGTTLGLSKNGAAVVAVTPYQAGQNFDFGGNPSKPNEMASFMIFKPQMVTNAKGELLLSWGEQLTTAQRKTSGDSGTTTITLLVQRFNSDLLPKDTKPIVVASTKNMLKTVGNSGYLVTLGSATYLDDFSIDMDDDGDFVVAYTMNKSISVKELSSPDGISVKDSSGTVMVRQFINATDKEKLVAGKAMKMPSTKLKTSHPQEKGKIKKSLMQEPSVVITHAANNEFAVAWHVDYQDVYAQGVDPRSLLQAARFSSQ